MALTAGSRGIDGYGRVLAATVRWLQEAQFTPFIFLPWVRMGRNRSGPGRRAGVTRDHRSKHGLSNSLQHEVVELGQTVHGVTVYLDQFAAKADAIIAVNRIKAHTNFRGHVESGLAKMLAIGAGKHAQALAIHAYGVDGLKVHMPQVAQIVLDKAPIIAGIGLLEDGQHQLSARSTCLLLMTS